MLRIINNPAGAIKNLPIDSLESRDYELVNQSGMRCQAVGAICKPFTTPEDNTKLADE